MCYRLCAPKTGRPIEHNSPCTYGATWCTSRTNDLDSSTSDSPRGVVVRRGRTDVNDRSVGRYLRNTAGVEAAVACVEMCLSIRFIFDMRCGRIMSTESRRFRAMLLYPCRRVKRVVIWCDADDFVCPRNRLRGGQMGHRDMVCGTKER